MSHTAKKILLAVLVSLPALAIFFACVGAKKIALWSFGLFALTAAVTAICGIFEQIDNGELDSE